MARDIFGNRKMSKVDRYDRRKVTYEDVRWEYVKMGLWFISAYLYFHFIIMGW